MKRFILTEEDKKEVINNYFGDFNQKFYDFLKANITVESRQIDNFPKPFVLLYIDGKSIVLNNSKKYLVSKLVNTFSDDFSNVPESSLRLTAKKFISELKQEYFGEQ
jgi:hypothetical protein